MERMFYHRRDTPGHIPMTSSSQWSGYLRSTLAELAISETVDESEQSEPAGLAEQRKEPKGERDTPCYSLKREPNISGSSRSPGFISRKDTPAFIYDRTLRMRSAFNRGVSESLIPEEETKTGDNTTDKKSKRGRKQKRKEKQREEDIAEQEASKQTPRRKISVGPTDAPAVNCQTEI